MEIPDNEDFCAGDDTYSTMQAEAIAADSSVVWGTDVFRNLAQDQINQEKIVSARTFLELNIQARTGAAAVCQAPLMQY